MEPLPPNTEALLTLHLKDAEAETRFGAGNRSGATWQQHVLDLLEQAEDCQSEIESSFEVPLREDEQDFEILDLLIANGWQEQAPSEEELAAIAQSWGGYIGNVVKDLLGGDWVLRTDPLHHSIRFPRTSTQFFPVHAVLRRFALGTEASLASAYEDLVASLAD